MLSVPDFGRHQKSGVGESIQSFVRIYGLGRGDSARNLRVSGDKIRAGDLGSFQFDKVFVGSVAEEASWISSLVNSSVNGYNSCVLLLGPTGSGKELKMHGDSRSKGLLQMIVERIFAEFEKIVKSREQLGSTGDRKLSLQLFRIAKDQIYDLLNPSNQFHLTTAMMPGGVEVPHATECIIRNSMEFMEKYKGGLRNLNEHKTIDPIKTRSTVCALVRTEFGTLRARMTFMCLPDSSKLTVPPSVLREREGPLLNNELLSFATVVRRMSNAHEAPYCDFTLSKTTHLLQDALGGNCRTFLYTNVRADASKEVAKTLELASLSRNIQNYPLRNDLSARMVLQRLRRTIGFLRQHQQAGSSASREEWDRDAYDAKLREVEQSRAKLVEEKRQMIERFKDFRDRFKKVMASKVDDQKRLIESEKERLRLSKEISDLKVNNTDAAEKGLSDKHKLEAKVLELESSLAKARAEHSSGTQMHEEVEVELKEKVSENENLKIELVSVRHTLNEVQKEFQEVRDRNKRISAEMLTLNNCRKTLEKNKLELENQVHRLSGLEGHIAGSENDKLLAAAKATERHLEAQIETSEKKLRDAKDEINAMKETIQTRSEEYRKSLAEKAVNDESSSSDGPSKDGISFAFAGTKIFREHVRNERDALAELVEQQSRLSTLDDNINTLVKSYRIIREYLQISSIAKEKWPKVLSEKDVENLLHTTTTNSSNVTVLKTLVGRVHSLQDIIMDSKVKLTELSKDNERLKRSSDGKSGKNSIEKLQEYIDKMMKKQVEKSSQSDIQKIHELQDKVAVLESKNKALSDRSARGDPKTAEALRKQLSAKEEEVKKQNSELMTLREKVHELQQKAKPPATPSEKKDTNAIKNELAEFSQGKLAQLEEDNSELKTKLLQAETELENFQEYMKDQIVLYQNQIIALKQELVSLRGEGEEEGEDEGEDEDDEEDDDQEEGEDENVW